MEPMDQLLRELPDQPLPPDLPNRARMNFRQRCQKAQRRRRTLSLALIFSGAAGILPGLFGLNFSMDLPQTGLGWARSSFAILSNPQGSVRSIPTLLDSLQSNLAGGLPASIWIGAALLAAGALLSLSCWMPQNRRSLLG